jgi:signal transduction histidine kinase/ActR/RegA family two-component response regulator
MGEWANDERAAEVGDLRQRLGEAERRLAETEALARVGSWEWQLPELRAAWSRELLRIFGRDPDGPPPQIEELIDSVHPDDRAGFRELVRRVRETPGPFRYNYRIVSAGGEVRHLQARGRTEADSDSRPIRSRGTTLDVTELKRSETQLERAQRLESVGQLAGGIAHDFNNLLSVILNNTENLLAEADAKGDIAAGLAEVEQAATSGADLTRRLLLFSRREATDLRPVDIAAAIGDAEALLRRTIGEQIELVVDAPAGLLPVSLAPGQAEQVLVNLAVNARDAMPDGGRIAICLQPLEAAGASSDPLPNLLPGAKYVVLSVVDDGIGMSAETAAQAFDPFFTTKPRGQGTGLGLATVYGIVNQAGGRVAIESEPGSGARVSAYLPVAAEAGPQPTREDSPQPSGEVADRTVLVVDNERAVRVVVCRMLERHGYRAREAGSGAAAEALLADGERVDLLLTDVVMPGMSGRELVARLRDRLGGPRAIYMSGFAATGATVEEPWEEGAIVLEKPFTAGQLLAALGEAMPQGPDGLRE